MEGLPPCSIFGHRSVSLWEWPSLLVSSRSLGECPPRREKRTPEAREEDRARGGAKQVGLQVSQEKDPRQGDWKLYLSHLQM